MKSKLKNILISSMTVLGLVALPVVPAYADDCGGSAAACIQSGTDSVSSGNQPKLQDQIKIISNILLFVLGLIAVIMIIIGGIRYTTSNGDPGATKAAKDTVLYAVVGLVVAILAYAIVNFVVTQFVKS